MRKLIFISLFVLTAALPAAAQSTDTAKSSSFIQIPGFDFFLDRARNHGFAGQAWDIDARPYQTAILSLNDKGPVYIALGGLWDAHADEAHPIGGVQFDALYLWREARNWKPLRGMELINLPENWRVLIGPMFNAFRVRPDHLRIDRDILFNAAIHIPLGAGK